MDTAGADTGAEALRRARWLRYGRRLGRGLAAIGFLALLVTVATRLPTVAADRLELYVWGAYAPLVGLLLVAIPFTSDARAGSLAAILVAVLAGAGVTTYTLGFWGEAQERELLRVERNDRTYWYAEARRNAGRRLGAALLAGTAGAVAATLAGRGRKFEARR